MGINEKLMAIVIISISSLVFSQQPSNVNSENYINNSVQLIGKSSDTVMDFIKRTFAVQQIETDVTCKPLDDNNKIIVHSRLSDLNCFHWTRIEIAPEYLEQLPESWQKYIKTKPKITEHLNVPISSFYKVGNLSANYYNDNLQCVELWILTYYGPYRIPENYKEDIKKIETIIENNCKIKNLKLNISAIDVHNEKSDIKASSFYFIDDKCCMTSYEFKTGIDKLKKELVNKYWKIYKLFVGKFFVYANIEEKKQRLYVCPPPRKEMVDKNKKPDDLMIDQYDETAVYLRHKLSGAARFHRFKLNKNLPDWSWDKASLPYPIPIEHAK